MDHWTVLHRIEKPIDTLPYRTAAVTIVTNTATYTLEKARPTVVAGFDRKELADEGRKALSEGGKERTAVHA